MGCGVLTTYTQIANIAGIQGLLVYALTGAIPIFLFSFYGPIIRKRCPEGFVLTEWVYQRYGPFAALFLSAFTLLTMFLYMVSELTAVNYAITALTGIDATPCVVIECVVTSIYTALGGFKVSFITDSFQAAFVILALIIGTIAYGCSIHIDMDIKRATEGFLLGSNKMGWMLLYILLVAIVTNDCFLSGFWLRTFAAKTDRDLFVGTGIAAIVCCIVCTLFGIPGILAVWTGDLTIADDEGYNAFFILIAEMDKWVIGIMLIFSVALSTCTFDSLQSATTTSISNDIFRNKLPMIWVRLIVWLVMVPCIVVAVKASANVLQIYLIADLLSSALIPIMFLGLSRRFNFLGQWDIIVGTLAALLAIFVFGTVYYGSALEGARLLLVWNGIYTDTDWGAFGAFVIAPVGGVVFGLMFCGARLTFWYVYSRIYNTPFTTVYQTNFKKQELSDSENDSETDSENGQVESDREIVNDINDGDDTKTSIFSKNSLKKLVNAQF
ncbi:hypothetical protein B5S28_g3351 [[Candida] boidinii]|uniref:Unnamed protein product n=1 Tax=Candida boidinii TaxID=5477 RepID=A0ACB5TFV7_CANBO|nr:hypothetical protein B5S28_g3351 [[Candida] boidinii]OWB59588.1 hypothetical protein B5S29_g448 [[Candida] boidinii]OWB70479.1 hypothetical protein B5S31_g157 [[Candida] boidinii]OWB75859.1 hypothetical protein B5S32_g6 [[Candida] boidinii]GME87621.1 unnamed protein product [[Candida] boidinii]